MKKILSVFVFLCFATAVSVQAQDIEKIREGLTAAREAYDGGNYRKAIEKAEQVEAMIGSTTKPATAYIKIMSYYKLKEYVNCMETASAYMKDNPAQDETQNEIQDVWQKAIDEMENREETILWLTKNLKEYFYFQKDIVVNVEPCQITIHYTRYKDKKYIRRKEVYPTKFNKIYRQSEKDDDYTISYPGKDVLETNLDTGTTTNYANSIFLTIRTPFHIVKEIERKMHHLNSFCTE